MPTDINNFALSLAVAIATATSLSMNGDRALWVHDADEKLSADIYTVLRVYGGNEPGNFAGARIPCVNLQADTRGFDSPAVLAQAWKVHEAFLESTGTPWLDHSVPAKKFDTDGATIIADSGVGNWIVFVKQFITVPGIVGRDEDDRRIASGNVQLEFQTAAQYAA